MRQHHQQHQQQGHTLFPPPVQRRNRRPSVNWQIKTDERATQPTYRTQAAPPLPREIEIDDEPSTCQGRERAEQGGMRRRVLVCLFVGMAIMFLLYQIGALIVLPFWTATTDQWNYGQERITHYDQDVGHGGISHFIAEDLRGTIIVFELPSDHPGQGHVYALGKVTDDQQPHVVTLHFEDVNRDGTLDILAQVDQLPIPFTLFNTGHSFQGNDPTYQQPAGGTRS
ncbi:MAG: hypothetical protein H0W02_24050 [Ktedonobacteraceae bacterium]|nr:hypothetical protein [Ktedonobacteraceae bacterium]